MLLGGPVPGSMPQDSGRIEQIVIVTTPAEPTCFLAAIVHAQGGYISCDSIAMLYYTPLRQAAGSPLSQTCPRFTEYCCMKRYGNPL
ncbi:MAG: hypothetical protein OHK0015_39630 [Chloroflexi bacterium OHK40]